MSHIEFEEKEFEGPLYNELLFGSHHFATPGQVFENAFGIDAALEAQHPIFWDSLGYSDIPKGIDLNHYRWGWVWRKHGKHRMLPSFSVNLLIQAKRPDYLLGRRSDFVARGIPSHYWRFTTRAHQQEMLEQLVKQLRHRALVVYASPAFHTLNDLYSHTKNKTLMENSSFVSPDRLKDHTSWNYNTPGTSGIAASIPKRIDDDSIYNRLDALAQKSTENNSKNGIFELNEAITETIKGLPQNPYSKAFNQSDRLIQDTTQEMGKIKQEVLQFTRVGRFFSTLGLQWLVS